MDNIMKDFTMLHEFYSRAVPQWYKDYYAKYGVWPSGTPVMDIWNKELSELVYKIIDL